MIGRKTLSQIREDLEQALGASPKGDGEVVESLRRFLSNLRNGENAPNLSGEAPSVLETAPPTNTRPAGDH